MHRLIWISRFLSTIFAFNKILLAFLNGTHSQVNWNVSFVLLKKILVLHLAISTTRNLWWKRYSWAENTNHKNPVENWISIDIDITRYYCKQQQSGWTLCHANARYVFGHISYFFRQYMTLRHRKVNAVDILQFLKHTKLNKIQKMWTKKRKKYDHSKGEFLTWSSKKTKYFPTFMHHDNSIRIPECLAYQNLFRLWKQKVFHIFLLCWMMRISLDGGRWTTSNIIEKPVRMRLYSQLWMTSKSISFAGIVCSFIMQ